MAADDQLAGIAARLADDSAWPEDAGEQYDAVIGLARDASRAAQMQSGSDTGTFSPRNEALDKLGQIARGLGDKLRAASADLGASSCSVLVSAWPPTIQVALNWDTRTR